MRARLGSILLLGALVACDRVPAGLARQTEGLYMPGKVPVGLPEVPYPAGSSMTPALVSLGRQLFFEERLSADRRRSCASCHDPVGAFTGGVAASVGGPEQPRNPPTLLNVAYRRSFGLDGRSRTLEERIRLELTDPRVMSADRARLERLLGEIDGYRLQFEAALGAVTLDGAVRALSAFLRTLLSGASPLDRFSQGDDGALTPAQCRGLALFKGKARCVTCHQGVMLSDGLYHNIGVGMERLPTDRGRALVTGRPADVGAFRTPSLRDVAETAPYMHDGSLASLADVVAFYSRGAVVNPHLDTAIEPLDLTDAEQAELVAFLHALSGQRPIVGEGERPE